LELKEQEKKHKMIEKELKKERRRMRLTYRMQLVGMEGSGKSVVIKQMELFQNKTFKYPVRYSLEVSYTKGHLNATNALAFK
jgi:septin family protein